MRTAITLLIGMFLLAAMAACNPTWTKEGKPNDSSMPLPPDARAPTQAGPGQASPKP